MSVFIEWDYAIFELINQAFANDFLDSVMPFWRSKETWYPFYLFLIAFMFFNFPWKKVLIFLIFIGVTFGITDFVGSQVVKDNVERPRPCHVDTQVHARTLVDCGSGFSFTSNHSSNHMAISIFLILTIGFVSRYFNYFLIFWAVSIGFGQIYVGLHYPLDVLGGFLLGGIIGYTGGYFCNKYVDLIPPNSS